MCVVFRLGKILLLDRCFHPSPNISSSNIIIYTFFILLLPVWTQKCAVQKASVDVNISYYPAMTAFADQYSLPNILFWYWSVINRTYKCKLRPHRGILFLNTYTKLFQILLSSSSKRLFTISPVFMNFFFIVNKYTILVHCRSI
jgi:hypothetical protein